MRAAVALEFQDTGFVPDEFADGRRGEMPDGRQFRGRVVFFFGEPMGNRLRYIFLLGRTGVWNLVAAEPEAF